MRCPECKADNPAEVQQCAACGTKLKQRTRQRETMNENDASLAGQGQTSYSTALAAYRCGLFSLIPLLGLLLGPIAVVLGLIAWRLDKQDPIDDKGSILASIILGTATAFANTIGVILIGLDLFTANRY